MVLVDTYSCGMYRLVSEGLFTDRSVANFLHNLMQSLALAEHCVQVAGGLMEISSLKQLLVVAFQGLLAVILSGIQFQCYINKVSRSVLRTTKVFNYQNHTANHAVYKSAIFQSLSLASFPAPPPDFPNYK